MSKTISTTSETLENIVDESTITEFLANNPDFFADKSYLLLAMTIPHESGQAISLLERQVNLLRERNDEKQDNINLIIANAKANDELFQKVRHVILDLLKTSSLAELRNFIESQLQTNLSASVSKLILISKLEEENKNTLKPLLNLQKSSCDALRPEQINLLFPDSDDAIVSAAIVPVNIENKAHSLLAIGSSKESYFHVGQDTLFLDFIGEVLAAHICAMDKT